MSNKIIIISLIIFLIVSFFYLAYIEQNQQEKENFWVVYFANPQDNNLDFIIENHSLSVSNNFHWEVLANKEKIKEGQVEINPNNLWRSSFSADNYDNKKITILVSDGNQQKEIYKIFKK